MKRKKHKAIKIIAIILGCILAALLLFAGTVLWMLNGRIKKLQQLDEEGYLYYAEYEGDYDNGLISFPCRLIQHAGCSAFLAKEKDGTVFTGRNYDLSHADSEEKPSGLNVVLRLNPKGKYRSINVADAAWITYLGLPYYKGALSDNKVTKLPLAFLPYLCMDGINEKGLSVSILALDVKEGETAVSQNVKGKKKILYEELLRILLDECTNLDEAVKKAEEYNISNILGRDYHLFVSDDDGKSAVLEWRYEELQVTYTDAVTNFYVGFDDADSSYRNGILKEQIEKTEGIIYRFGYGHGYDRFVTIAEGLDKHRVGESTAVMDKEAMRLLLEETTQAFHREELTSLTQYHALYGNTEKTLDIYPYPSYNQKFTFSFEK